MRRSIGNWESRFVVQTRHPKLGDLGGDIDRVHVSDKALIGRPAEIGRKASAELESNPLRFSCDRDWFTDIAYRNVFYRKSHEEEEQEDRAIFFIEPDGRTQPAEAHSEVIMAISGIETAVYRLYYDDRDPMMMKRLEEEGWLGREERTQPAKEETP